jgi:serine/threonine-protein kinase
MSDPPVRLILLGGIDLTGAPSADARQLLSHPKTVALLAVLTLSTKARFQRRDRIVGMLWPELDQAHARAALRKATMELRARLGPAVLESRGDEEIALSEGVLTCDVVEFLAAIEHDRLAGALELYRGELMPGFHIPESTAFDDWLEGERKALVERATAAAWALAQVRENDAHLTEAGTLARRAVQYSGTDERILRRTLLMLERIGDRAGALKLYEGFAQRVRRELDVDPSAETVALVGRLRQR